MLIAAVLVVVVAVLVVKSSGGSSSPALHGLSVIPFPDTPDASPQTHINFFTLRHSEIKRISVRGSVSGPVSGRVVQLPAGGGASFVPDHPFRNHDRVTVNATLGSTAAAAAAGAHHGTTLTFTFIVARPVLRRPSHKPPAAIQDIPGKTQTFVSRPDLHPPVVATTGSDPDTRSGEIFIETHSVQQSGPEVLDAQGHLLWFSPLAPGLQAFNTQAQRYAGQPVLTFWQGQLVGAHGTGQDVILNRSYQPVATVNAGNGYKADLHEFVITPRGTALITAYVPVRRDLSSVGGGPRGVVLDGVVQEIDIRTGQVLWEWHSLGHVPLSASEQHLGRGRSAFDYFHINSVQELPDGNFIISARNTWAVYEVSRKTGGIIWQLGGKGTSFKMGSGTGFSWQHDARLRGTDTLTLFDNAGTPREEPQSRAITLKLDPGAKSASLASSLTHVPPVLAGSQGNLQDLPNGNRFVGWGSEPFFSEYDGRGHQVFGARFPRPTQSYRAYRFPWTGTPTAPPDLALSPNGSGLIAYASWNGATQVASWQLMGGSSAGALTPIARVPRSGFETTITSSTRPVYATVRALDAAGHVLGTAKVVPSP